MKIYCKYIQTLNIYFCLFCRQKIVLGPDTVNNNNMFHGIISQVNMYDSMLNATDIATGSGNCSVIMPSGTVFRWQDFSSHINSDVEVIEPSVCRSGGCSTGYSGQFCNSTKGKSEMCSKLLQNSKLVVSNSWMINYNFCFL